MIFDEQQETAALYALGMLDAREASTFERAMAADAALRDLARELRDAAASVARDVAIVPPPAGLRAKILRAVAPAPPVNIVRFTLAWVPWAAAAALALCCGVLATREGDLRREMASLRGQAAATAPADGFAHLTFCSLDPVPPEKPQPRASVAWDAGRRLGVVRLSHLEPPAEGKDYQLWVVEEGVKKPVSAGVVHVDGEGRGEAVFKPVTRDAQKAQAFAISMEQAGGVPEGQGPVVLMGKL